MASGVPSDRPPLTRQRILAAAVELADEQGLAGLSMRKLAGHLGFEVMSLYNHVAHKRDLLEGMLDLVAGEVELPVVDGDVADGVGVDDPGGVDGWKAGLRALSIAQHELLKRHRWAGPISTDHFPGPNRWRIFDRTLQLLAAGGVDGHLRDVGYHALTLHIAGFTAQQLAYEFEDDATDEIYARVAREFDASAHPWMAAHVAYHLDPSPQTGERPDTFGFVLDLILDGIERARDAA